MYTNIELLVGSTVVVTTLWQNYMKEKDCWITFYEWKKQNSEEQMVQMMQSQKEVENPRHNGKA